MGKMINVMGFGLSRYATTWNSGELLFFESPPLLRLLLTRALVRCVLRLPFEKTRDERKLPSRVPEDHSSSHTLLSCTGKNDKINRGTIEIRQMSGLIRTGCWDFAHPCFVS